MASEEGPYPWWSNLVIAAHEQNCTTELLAWREIAALRAERDEAREVGRKEALSLARRAVRRHVYDCCECKDTTCGRIDMELRAAEGEAYAVTRITEYGDDTERDIRAFLRRTAPGAAKGGGA